ncbi:hypothetical protein CC86DRAFT_277298 [Ophiobolus disseminans]|uniref:Uncharacterized protein n=1 Tax=Ophiobolus disseminans TaxID=1469910 RepID=A0A6A7AN59_9PLEO|nr:hypothetical protein CC86DRAFT_277298 [Ophiobolus disseminans]
MPSYNITTISASTYSTALSRYASAAPASLHALDAQRYDAIPAAVAKRRDDKFLNKSEVEKLVEWKLKHGTFRPKLLQLAQSNDEGLIKETTTSAFGFLKSSPSPSSKDILAALKILIKLKGIGPATASLLLSVAAPETVPFFSDELFRWCTWNESGSPAGWKRGIKYNMKEYEALLGNVGNIRERMDVRAVDVERVAWVLGREGVDCGDGEDSEETIEERETEEKAVKADTKEKPKKAVEKGTKRKAADVKPPTEGTRKSARTKK